MDISLAIADGRQAIQVVRECASEWGISFESIGIIGFSTGGTVAMGAVGGQTPESRADFLAAIYAATDGCYFASAGAHASLCSLRQRRSHRRAGQRGRVFEVEGRRLSRRAAHVF